MYSYTALQWLLFFYIYCFLGWLWESCYVSFKKKKWVNRGFLQLPLLPIYGSGAIVVLFVSLPLKNYIVLVYLAGAAAATLLELVVGLSMEAIFKVKYWDYSEERFQYKGVICLSSTLFWGVLSVFLTEVAQSPLEKLVFAIPVPILAGLVTVISLAFVYDTVISVKAALDLAKVLTAIEKAKEELAENLRELEERAQVALEEFEDRLEDAREELADRLEDAREELGDRLKDVRADMVERVEESRKEFEARMENVRDSLDERKAQNLAEYQRRKEEMRRVGQQKIEALLEKAERVSKGAARRNPSMSSRRFDESIRRLHQRSGRKKR